MTKSRKKESISIMRPVHFVSSIVRGTFDTVSAERHWQSMPSVEGAHQSLFSQIADIACQSPRRYFLPLVGAYQAMKSKLYDTAKN